MKKIILFKVEPFNDGQNNSNDISKALFQYSIRI